MQSPWFYLISTKTQQQTKYTIFLLVFTFVLLLSSCSSTHNKNTQPQSLNNDLFISDKKVRYAQMQKLVSWKITGKIAFIHAKKRQSANFYWQHLNKDEQQINLTTFLGINLMELTSNKGMHTINVRGENYHNKDLNTLIYQLTGFQLPTQALNYWLKGLSYLPNDEISFNKTTLLPQTLTSFFNAQFWQINYQGYKLFNGHELATKITLKQKDLTIKIVINNWNL